MSLNTSYLKVYSLQTKVGRKPTGTSTAHPQFTVLQWCPENAKDKANW